MPAGQHGAAGLEEQVGWAVPRAVLTRRGLAAVGLALAVVGAGTGWSLTRRDAAASAPAAATATATVRNLERTVTASGVLQPARSADLAFAVTGTVTSVPVTIGQQVKAGDVLATVDPTALQTAVTTATASVTAASQALAAQRAAGATSTAIAAAQAQLAVAQSDLEQARSALAQGTLTSTIDGTVAAVGIAVGDRVRSGTPTAASGSAAAVGSSDRSTSSAGSTSGAATGSGTGSGTITVISTDAFTVQAQVAGADLASVRKGLQARITPTGSSQRVFGTVSTVGIVATTSAVGTATFPVAIAVTGNPTGLYAGGTASVQIVVAQLPNVLTVPTSAITTGADGTTVVTKVVGSARVPTPVTIGTAFGPTTQVTSGLAEGDVVVLPAQRAVDVGTRPGTGRQGGSSGIGTGGGGGHAPGGGADGGAP